MGYLFLVLALLSGAVKGFCGKKVSGFTKEFSDAALINFLRMAFCIVIGAVIMLAQSVVPFTNFDIKMILIAALSGVSTAIFVISWLLSVKTGAYVMLDVVLMLGVGVTVSCCFAFLGEDIRLNQMIGFIILVIAAYIMCSYNISLNGKMSAGKIGLLVVCGVANGITDFSQKLFTTKINGGNAAEFNFYTYIFAAIVLFITYIFIKLRKRKDADSSEKAPVPFGKIIIFVAVMAVCLFLNSYFKTLASAKLDSAILYPLNQGGALILSLIMAAVFFKEKVTVRCVVGICMAFAALLIINLL